MSSKIAIITGASRGLDRNRALNLALRGVDILFTYQTNRKEAENLTSEVEEMSWKAAQLQLDTGALTPSMHLSPTSGKLGWQLSR